MKIVPKAEQATQPEVIPLTFTGHSSPISNQGTVPTPIFQGYLRCQIFSKVLQKTSEDFMDLKNKKVQF